MASEPRKLFRSGSSLAVGVPAVYVKRLRMTPGQVWYVTMGKDRTVHVTPHPLRRAGKPGAVDDRRTITAIERELERWKARAMGRPMRFFNEGVGQGWAQAQKHLETAPGGAYPRLLAEIAALRETLVQVVGGSARLLAARQRPVEPPPQ